MIRAASRAHCVFTAVLTALMTGVGMMPARAAPPEQNGPPLPDTARIASWQQAILARPLFNPTRRPADMPDAGAATPRLAGIVVSHGRRRAIFMIPGQDRGRIVDVGDSIGPWQIVAIENTAIRVRDMTGEHPMRPDRDRQTDTRTGGASPESVPPRPEEQ